MNKFLIILFCCFAAVRSSFAATESFRVRKETSQLVVSSSVPLMTLYDDKYMTMATNANWSSLFTNYKVKNYLRVGINPDVPQTNDQTGSVSFKLKLWKWDAATNAFVTSIETQTLSLNYINSNPTAIVDEIATYAFADAHRVEVYLTAISGTPFEVNDIYVSAEVEVERYYTFDGGAVSGLSVAAVASDPNQPSNLNYLRFDWNHKTGAEFYELEWVHISDATLQTNVFKSTTDLTYNYYLNSTRVLVRGNSYRIPKIFDHGYVLYRVRAIGLTGSSFSIRKDGAWSNAAESGTVASHNAANTLFISGDYDPGMNWAHQVAYGDNGERFESVSFADGLGRGRQSVGHNTETQQAVVSNVYYDELGRPVISDLPTPQDYEVLQHKPGFNETAVDDATAYQQQFFDTDASDACNPVSEGMSTTSGAGKYYSPSNPDQDGENARIPDAEKFPFSRVTYRNDFTGRVDKVSSAGDDLKTGGGHETQFAYPSANQDELNKLFGAEVGQASHYQKMVTIDANGQVYVQYSDLAGRVIASYLEGDSPQNVDAIEGNATNTVTTHLLPQNEQNINSVVPSATLTYNEYISQNASYTFNYAFTPKQFHDVCMGQAVCLDCVYDLTIKIVDNCNQVVYSNTQPLIGADLDKLCATKPEVTITTPAVVLSKGEYQIVKTLSVNQQAIKDNWCYYVDNATCIEPLSNLFNEQYTTEPFADCNPGVTETPEDECAVRKALMLKDLSPGGQYAGYVNSGGTPTALTAGAAVHSVLTLNSLGTDKDWKHPVPYYKNADGTAALVNGEVPQNLSFPDFVTYFQPSWAEALLSYHPENCFLQFCESAGYDASKDYDAAMLATPSFSGACPAGYYKPLSNTQVTTPVACTTFVSGDPFFVSGGVGNSKYNDMNTAMNNYQGSGYTIWQYAVYEAFCNGTGSISTCLDNYNRLGTTEKNCYNDLIWVTYRSMYLELKANFVYQIQHSQAGCSNAQIGVDANWLNNHAIWGNLATMPDVDGDGFPENGSGLTQAEFETYMDNQAATQCQTVCEEYANEWLGVLSGCEQIAALSEGQLAALKTDLINLCKSGCNSDHPMGSSTSPTGQTIDDVLLTHLGEGYEDAFCTGLLISEPAPYQTTTELENAVIKPLDVCACDAVLQANWDLTNNNPANYTLEQLLAANTGVSLEDANYLICTCDKFVAGAFDPEKDNWVDNANQLMAATGITIPATLACNSGNGCVDCATVNTHYNTLIQRFSGVTDFTTTATYPVILTNYLNNKLHFTLGYNDYTEFIGKCGATAQNPYCSVNPKMKEWAETMTLLAFRGMVMRPQNNPVNLATNNIVFNNSDWKESLNGDNYWSSLSGNVLTTYFGVNANSNCQIQLTLPENAAFGFDDIVSFGEITPSTTNCTGNNDFTITVRYFSCGQLTTATLTGTSSCMQVNECVCSNTGLTLCDALPELTDICYQPRLDQLYQNALETYAENMDALYDTYLAAYNSACDDAFSTEALSYSGPKNAYHYTLFYYDQAGNLVKTIAPEGTHSAYDPANADAARNSVTNFTTYTNPSTYPVATPAFPNHTFQTTYAYNSYDQLVSTSNPDQDGATKYWYDRYGRIVASQNPVQLQSERIAYVLYDKQGRPVETGHTKGTTVAETVLKANDKGASFKTWVYSNTRQEVTYTVYDAPMSAAVSAKFAAGIQQNLRLRVASVVYFDAVSASVMPTTGYVSANHYSYDLHGNVIETLQDVPELVPVHQDIKSTQYTFELLSGNVKKVEYQKNKPDRTTHEYTYDRLNRLTEVWTSTDGEVHKSRDAHYRYFDYGPLSRVEIGHHKVQGNDYAYTINGWLKSMNGTTLDHQRDGGKDGGLGYLAANNSVNQLFASDVIGYTLGYYKGDYKSIGITGSEAVIGSGNALSNAIKSLYNGNIAYTTMAVEGYETKAGVYVYDQLQRLKAMRIFHASALQVTNNWSTSIETQEYSSSYAYDRNGNLKSLVRKGSASIALDMDNFAYKYVMNSNRLTYVEDGSSQTSAYTNDINSGQTGTDQIPITDLTAHLADNYQYDKLGQLVKDVQEGNQEYTWRTGDKKLKLQKSSTKQLEFVYNPFGQRVLKIEKAISGGAVVAQNITPWIYTYYAYDANGQVMATYNVTMMTGTNTAKLDEQLIYGAGRLGVVQSSNAVDVTDQTTISNTNAIWINKLGKKTYELTNHLGNVNALITDRKVVNPDYTLLVNENYASSGAAWSTSSSCGTPNFTVSGGNLTVTNGNCTMLVARQPAATANTTYTFSVDVIDHSQIGGFSIELLAGPSASGPFTLIAPAFTNVPNGRFSYTFTTPAGTTNVRYAFKKLTTENGAGFTIDNLYLGTATAQYSAVVLQKMDYYPFGMEMPGGIKKGAVPSAIAESILEEPVKYTNLYRLRVNYDGDVEVDVNSGLPPSSSDNNANSVQTVLPGEYIEWKAGPEPVTSNRTFVGLSYVEGGSGYATIKYSWYLYPNGGAFIIESGVSQLVNPIPYSSGTVFRIAREGGNIVYYMNGVVKRTVADPNPTASMLVDIDFFDIPGVVPRVYKLKVGKKAYHVEEPVTYTNYHNTFTNADGDLQLASTSAASSTDNAANGVQMVMPGEYIEFTASPSPIGSNRNFVGLSYVDGGFLQTSINYSWYLYPDGGNHIVENGSIPYSNYTAYVPGVTKFRIARTGGNIVYYKNGVVIRTVAETNPNLPMVIDITIWNTNTADPTIVYQLKVGKLTQVMATYGSGDYLPYTHADYRFGYNGMEKDPEQKGEGNSYTTEFRQYDPRLGRWLSLDPLMASFPWQSPYCAFDNNPVVYTDPYGLSATNPDGGEINFGNEGCEMNDGAVYEGQPILSGDAHDWEQKNVKWETTNIILALQRLNIGGLGAVTFEHSTYSKTWIRRYTGFICKNKENLKRNEYYDDYTFETGYKAVLREDEDYTYPDNYIYKEKITNSFVIRDNYVYHKQVIERTSHHFNYDTGEYTCTETITKTIEEKQYIDKHFWGGDHIALNDNEFYSKVTVSKAINTVTDVVLTEEMKTLVKAIMSEKKKKDLISNEVNNAQQFIQDDLESIKRNETDDPGQPTFPKWKRVKTN